MVELHLPVLEKEVLNYLDCRGNGVYVDATVGDGGHAEAICRSLDQSGRLIGIDWDAAALDRAKTRLSGFLGQVNLIHDSYTRLEEILGEMGYPGVNGILIDLGASTLQLMDPERGFSFHQEGSLDMRMDRRLPLSAKEIVNSYSAVRLADVFFRFGEERWSKRIAARIVQHRQDSGSIVDSRQLAEIVKLAVPARFRRQGGHPARRTFQALRLAVNQELDNLTAVLPQALRCLAPGGRLCVISYHSLEDRIVKHFFREQSKRCDCLPHSICVCRKEDETIVLTPQAIKPSEMEVNNNPRSRSARLRAVMRRESAS
ncbi:MAG TPA: 16S rRNA (cytosine(1402)-N(4))-methyltransferase RsmH [Candidatus Limnocylindrales bacterium]|nr:16S rRNA (cytosine(1402)-N(4))-methyltransferase RsmH [Candidatus Limnocylindrales bacterium]